MADPLRPNVSAELVARLIDQAPTRVQKRLDKNPLVADTWTWSRQDNQITVVAGEETVRLVVNPESNSMTELQQLSCTCLLAPKCFHLLACASRLPLEQTVDSSATTDSVTTLIDDDQTASAVEVTAVMRQAASNSIGAIETVLSVGSRNCGVVVQSTLLRAAHQCRRHGLIHLSAALIRSVQGIRQLKSGSDGTDTEQLKTDLARTVVLARAVLRHDTLEVDQVGQVRRPFTAVDVSRLQGVLAEPIVTRSGFAGTVVHFIANDTAFYEVGLVRPGEPSLASQAYQGGIDLGSTTLSAFELCRATLDVQNLTASPDHRLGRGTKTRWARRKPVSASDSTADDGQSTAHDWNLSFAAPFAEQLKRLFDAQQDPGQATANRHRLVGFECTVLGPHHCSVAVSLTELDAPLFLEIPLDIDALPYRANLELLSRSAGLRLRVVGRPRPGQSGSIDPLMICPLAQDDATPRLELPESWRGVCQLGLDRLERHFFSHTDQFGDTDTLNGTGSPGGLSLSNSDLSPGLTRQLSALVLGGRRSVAALGSRSHRRQVRALQRRNQTMAASLAETIASQASLARPTLQLTDLLAAANEYEKASLQDYQRQAWNDWLHPVTPADF
ncbi:hypothetical protein NHH03_09610 [Stieleria sp. TO1_6]|uniref:hypothetical protein n=1 Tax=Stieleria tagensis TaxID=2956795 RepID=UPI00209B2BE2|nr:hypothetical protein [Stieleria tagensis]MCO8121992.1 hypothetical protein [Stieleria tagensis]